MRCAFLVLAACGASPTQPATGVIANVAPPPAAPSDAYCPSVIPMSWWAHELFPACQPPPFTLEAITLCGGKACPLPCARALFRRGERVGGDVFHYDERDRFIASTHDGRSFLSDEACTYDAAGHLASCSGEMAERDEHGRLVGIAGHPTPTAIAYDARGRVIAVGSIGFEYDAAGRLARFGDIVLERERDRVVRERSASEPNVATLTYDATGRAIGKAMRFGQDSTGELEYTVEYDGDRVKRTTVGFPGHGRPTEYDYSCRR